MLSVSWVGLEAQLLQVGVQHLSELPQAGTLSQEVSGRAACFLGKASEAAGSQWLLVLDFAAVYPLLAQALIAAAEPPCVSAAEAQSQLALILLALPAASLLAAKLQRKASALEALAAMHHLLAVVLMTSVSAAAAQDQLLADGIAFVAQATALSLIPLAGAASEGLVVLRR